MQPNHLGKFFCEVCHTGYDFAWASYHDHYVCKDCINDLVAGANTPQDHPFGTMCVMCGKEYDTYLRSDNKYYCTHCWMTWNS